MELNEKYQPSYWICLFRCLLILLKKRKKYYFCQICNVPFLLIFVTRVSVRVQQLATPKAHFFHNHPLLPYTPAILVSFIGSWNFSPNRKWTLVPLCQQPAFFLLRHRLPPSCLFVESKSSCQEKVNKCNMFPYFMVVNGSKMKKNKWNWFCEIYWEFCFFPMITV